MGPHNEFKTIVFCDLLGTSYVPVSKVVTAKAKLSKHTK